MATENGNGRTAGNGGGNDREAERLRMVNEQIRHRGIADERVLAAMETVPRHRFVSPVDDKSAYTDNPLPIGFGQTISQPYVVALMTELCRPKPTDRVLEIGTGCGYQTAVLAELVGDVFSIEFVERLGRRAEELLSILGYGNVRIRIGNGYVGWPKEGPFDAIVVTAAPPDVPQALVDQLVDGGRLVIPVGITNQELVLIEKDGAVAHRKKITDVRFVPMVRDEGELPE
jgi:protein-L-isoaspartate(D-aspartate) O-methyltransferase